MCLFSQLLSPQIPNASYPHPHPPAASFLFYKSDGDLKTLIITWIHFGESQSLHSCTRFPPSLTSSRTRFHWLSFLFPRSLLILCWIIPLVIQTIIALILFFKSWLEPTSLANYLFFFSLLLFCSKIPPSPMTTLKLLVSGYSVTSVLPNPVISITSYLSWPLSSVSPSWSLNPSFLIHGLHLVSWIQYCLGFPSPSLVAPFQSPLLDPPLPPIPQCWSVSGLLSF